MFADFSIDRNGLRQVMVPIVADNICDDLHEKRSPKSYTKIHVSMLCAGHDEGKRDACTV
jgi:hypothetical protein